jgi:hypothetical protein
VLRGWNTAALVYTRDAEAASKYRELLDRFDASIVHVQRRGNVVVTYTTLSPDDPRLLRPGVAIDPSLYDGSFERRVTAALERL